MNAPNDHPKLTHNLAGSAIDRWENEGGAHGHDSPDLHYGRRVEADRSWTVYHVFTGVPVAVKKIGVYYGVEKVEGKYLGKHTRPWYKFWQKGSQDFLVRPGDKLTVMASIFSPSNFHDKVYLQWFHDDPRFGWKLEDSIPLSILGGRDEGFRGYGTKQFYSLGDWKVVVETSDGREVGRISFEVANDESSDVREFKTDVF